MELTENISNDASDRYPDVHHSNLMIDGRELRNIERRAYIRGRKDGRELRVSQNTSTSDEALTIPVVVGRSEQLKAEVFKLANKLAVAGEGDAAVAMHRIHNRL